MNLQERIDEIAYPPTHQYDLETLEPKDFLKQRFDLMPEDFFHGKSFLDIGNNKGFFSLYAKKHCEYVEGLDYDKKCVELCNDLGIPTTCTTFRDYIPKRQFDRILMGNIMHYMYRECNGWEFITKLAAISTGQVLIEAPTGMDCKAMNPVFETKHLRKNFNEKLFFKSMERYFVLKSKVKSPSNNRWIMLWERKPINKITFNELKNMNEIKNTNESVVYTSNEKIAKIQVNHSVTDFIKTFISSESPISNGVLEWIVNENGEYIGWTEQKEQKQTIPHRTQQSLVLPQLIKHQLYLTKLGYHEMDMGVSNFFEDGIMFDKGGVWHIKEMQKEGIDDVENGYFFKMMKSSFGNYPFDYNTLHRVLNTRDSFVIEEFYEKLAGIVKENVYNKVEFGDKIKMILQRFKRK